MYKTTTTCFGKSCTKGLTTFTSFHAPQVPLTDLDFFTENFQREKKKKVNCLD